MVCYYTNWSVYRPGTARFNPQNINPYLCTHLIYAFGGFTKDNTLKPFDKYQDIEKGMLNLLYSTLIIRGTVLTPNVVQRKYSHQYCDLAIKLLSKQIWNFSVRVSSLCELAKNYQASACSRNTNSIVFLTGGYAKFTGLKTYNKNLKTMLAIGGWNEGSTKFSPMVASKERRKEFVRNAIKVRLFNNKSIK